LLKSFEEGYFICMQIDAVQRS